MIHFETNYAGDTYHLNHPRILWNSVTRRATLAVSTEAAGFAGVNSLTATEHDTWKPTAMPATWTLTFDATETVNALGVDTHTIGTAGATVTLQEWTGAAWADVVAATPDDDEPIAFLFYARSTDRLRLSLTGAVAPKLGVVVACEAIELPQTVYMGAATPIDLARITQYESTMSTGGRYMGRSVQYAKPENEFKVEHLREDYVRDVLDPFFKDAREYPYFLLERPYDHPHALSYRWRDQDIRPDRMGIRNLMQVDL